MVIECKGKLVFQPENKTKKHENQDWKKVAMIMLDCDIERYYAWFLSKRFRLIFNKTLRGSHVTIISDRLSKEKFQKASNKYNGKEITFYYEIEPRTNGKHWWLRVHCPEAEEIREEIGLNRQPFFGYHLTIGHMNDLNISHSEYIYNNIKLFNLLSSEPRKSLEQHEIIKTNSNLKHSTWSASNEFIYNGKKVISYHGRYFDEKSNKFEF
jgi:hypothetical protein